jgi:ParB/RepB/Spo0J family partition protein
MIEPLQVVAVGDRYEVVDGYRRYQAAKLAGLLLVPCLIYPTKEVALEGVKFAANAFREDMSPADEAVFFHQLFEHECEHDVDRICALVNKKRGYVEARLALLDGDEAVFNALRAKSISIGVAQALNQITDEGWRRHYLHFAIQGGATIAMVTGWVTEWKNMQAYRDGAPQQPQTPATPIVASDYNPLRCYVCGRVHEGRVPTTITVDAACLEAILNPLLASYRGEP